MGIRYDNTVYGLSPLARGTRGNGNRPRGRGRFIPAGAGNTMSGTMPRLSGPVYPRWRGEHPMDPTFAVCVTGLSPLARGTLQLDARMNLLTRFIPAGAGNTRRMIDEVKIQAVYPRWRGEHDARIRSWFCHYGLSPLARGTPTFRRILVPSRRFIPAGAGNTMAQIQLIKISAVYPRWRGEHSTTAEGMKNLGGLSPLARGTLSLRSGRRLRNRFIPAGAGNTVFRTSRGLLGPVYPRWRGEHLLWRWRTEYRCGLSPLARGTLILVAHADPVPRFIPAGAGNTIRTLPMILLKAVYPRWRGEHTIVRFNNNDRSGLSPLARGTLPAGAAYRALCRFIPAGAGNTRGDPV